MQHCFVMSIMALLLGALSSVASTTSAATVHIEFDYSMDTNNFFDPTTPEGLQRREVLDLAASMYAFADQLAPIAPTSGNTWSATVFHPSTFQSTVVTDRSIPENTIVIYPGGRPIAVGGVLGFANAVRDVTASGSADFVDAVFTRGQENATGAAATDFGVAMGSITFFYSEAFQWHYGLTTDGLDSSKSDFFTTAVHEIGHLLGFGQADSWYRWIEEDETGDYYFHGPESMSLFGGPVPLDSYGSHIALGLQSLVQGELQSLLMDPSTPRGVRELPTELDLALFRDIGWVVVPEPSTCILALGAAASLFLLCRRGRV